MVPLLDQRSRSLVPWPDDCGRQKVHPDFVVEEVGDIIPPHFRHGGDNEILRDLRRGRLIISADSIRRQLTVLCNAYGFVEC